jgi:glutamate--cysteine ligase catalytic subunit
MEYMDFLLNRAKGKLPTAASFIRQFVASHPEYKQDSIVTPQINCDLMRELRSANEPDSKVYQSLLGQVYVRN